MIHVKWGREVLHFPIPSLDTPLGALRAELAAYTHLPVGSFKLVYKGAVMKEDGAPLSTYKLKENATIALIGGDTLPPGPGPRPGSEKTGPAPGMGGKGKGGAPQTEAVAIAAIRAELERVRETLVPDVERLVGALAEAGRGRRGEGGHPESGSGPKTRTEGAVASRLAPPTPPDHTRLSELLLQSLLRLDALYVPGVDWPEARVERKAAVREVQGVLDRLDTAGAAR